jgi:subtilisin family serine protease
MVATADNVVPANVCRVVGVPQDAPAGSPTVWIVDSGVDEHVFFAGLLNIREIVDCTFTPCRNVYAWPGAGDRVKIAEATDTIGHGTMVAAIVGGDRPMQFGLKGVSPKVKLKIVKSFRKRSTNILGAPNIALRYVRDNAVAGDILNLSWGGNWLESARRGHRFERLKELDALLYEIADRQVRIVVAAGNEAQADQGPWVQTFFPANAAPYESQVTGGGKPAGAIYSVSATESEFIEAAIPLKCLVLTDGWCDSLWRPGAFGASYAEPGVNILSVWKSRQNGRLRQNVCSGTSFAAPALAGLLVREPKPLAKAAINEGLITDTDHVGYNSRGRPVGPGSDHPTCQPIP